MSLPGTDPQATLLPAGTAEMHGVLRSMGWQHPERIPAVPAGIPDGAFETDKIVQQYMPVYEELARELGPAARVCEIGVWHGGSLATWKVKFPDGLIAGVDIDPRSHWPEGTVRVVCPQDDESLPGLLAGHSAQWDLIIDDASHDGTLTARTFGHLWPLVRPGGYYVIEDWFVGWWEGQEGTYSMLDLARGMLEFLRGESGAEEVRYRYGLIIIRKAAHAGNMAQVPAEPDRMARENPLRVGQAASPDGGVPGGNGSGHPGHVAA